jgi:hypothetical protein
VQLGICVLPLFFVTSKETFLQNQHGHKRKLETLEGMVSLKGEKGKVQSK